MNKILLTGGYGFLGRHLNSLQELKWQNKVHEILIGSESHTELPFDENFAIKHPKEIQRQE